MPVDAIKSRKKSVCNYCKAKKRNARKACDKCGRVNVKR